MFFFFSEQSQQRVKAAVSTASSSFGVESPSVQTEMLDGPDGSALHLKVTVPGVFPEEKSRPLMMAIRAAVLDTLPEIPSIPLVTLLRSRA